MKKNLSKIRQIKSVNILGRKYKIKKRKGLTLNGDNVGGLVDPNKRVIYMNDDLNDNDYLETLCHETSHIIKFTVGSDQVLSNMEIEIFCQSFASGFYDLITGSIL